MIIYQYYQKYINISGIITHHSVNKYNLVSLIVLSYIYVKSFKLV